MPPENLVLTTPMKEQLDVTTAPERSAIRLTLTDTAAS